MIQLAKTDKRAKKTEIDSLKADIDFFLEENASYEDKVGVITKHLQSRFFQQKWIDCVTKSKTSTSTK